MRSLFTVIFLALSISVFAQTEEQQKQQKKVENSRPQESGVQPSFAPRPYPIWPTYPYYTDYNRRYIARNNATPTLTISASVAVPFLITDPTTLGIALTIQQNHGLYLHARQSKSNPYKYYDNISRLEAEQWGDQYQGLFNKHIDIGIGYLIDKSTITHIIGLNIQTQTSDLNYQDQTGILPYRGDLIYSIERETRTYIKPMYGIQHPVPNTDMVLGAQTIIQRHPIVQANVGFSF